VSTVEKYVTAAYLVVFVAVLVYVLIIAAKLQRLSRQVDDLVELVRQRSRGEAVEREPAQVG
jgi:CcmD family protein